MVDEHEKNKTRAKLGLPEVSGTPTTKDLEKITSMENALDKKDKLSPADNTVKREVQIAKVEKFMVAGTDSAYKISKQTGIDRRTVANYIEAVKARWAMAGSKRSLQHAKGAGLARISRIKQELWDVMEGRSMTAYTKGKGKGKVKHVWKPQDVDSDTKIKALKALMDCHEKELYLDGCSADMLKELPSSFDSGGALSVTERKAAAERQKQLVSKWLEFVEESRKTNLIDITPET